MYLYIGLFFSVDYSSYLFPPPLLNIGRCQHKTISERNNVSITPLNLLRVFENQTLLNKAVENSARASLFYN